MNLNFKLWNEFKFYILNKKNKLSKYRIFNSLQENIYDEKIF